MHRPVDTKPSIPMCDPAGNRLQKNDSGSVTGSQYNDANGNLLLHNTGGALTTSPGTMGIACSPLWRVPESSTTLDTLRTDWFRGLRGVSTVNKVWDDQNLHQERSGDLTSKLTQYADFSGCWGGLSFQRRSSVSRYKNSSYQRHLLSSVCSRKTQ